MQIKLFNNKKVFKKGGIHINPDVYWVACLLVAFLVVIISMSFGIYLFIKTNKELTMAMEDNTIQTQNIDRQKLDKVLNLFSEREQKSIQILNTPAPFIDPSL